MPHALTQMIARRKAVRKIFKAGGKIFAVKFIKKDGTERFMICRRGVQKHLNLEGELVGLKGTGMSYNPEEKRLITVFDLAKREYRMVNELSLREVHIDGIKYLVKEAYRDGLSGAAETVQAVGADNA